MGDDEPAGLLDGGGDGVEVDRGDRAEVDDLDAAAVLGGGRSGGEGDRDERAVGDDGRVGALADHVGAERVSARARVLGVDLALEPVAALRLEHDDRVLRRDGLLGHPVGVVGVGRGDDTQARGVGEERLGRLGVVLDRADTAAVRDADGHGDGQLAVAAGVELGELGGDLVEAGEDEAVELNLRDWAVAAQGKADARADDPGLCEWAVDDTVAAEVRLEALGHPVDAAERADVLAHEHHGLVVGQGGAEARVDRLRDGHRGHQRPPSWVVPSVAWSAKPASYRRCHASSSATSG